MSSLQTGSRSIRAPSPSRFLLAISTAALLCLSCSTTPHAPRDNLGTVLSGRSARLGPQSAWGGQLNGERSRFNQSCGVTCAAPVNPSTGELLAPAVSRTGSGLVEGVVQTLEAAQGLLTVQRLLTGAELDLVEATLRECVAQAHADVNETYQQREGGFKFKNGKFPNDTECDRHVGSMRVGGRITLAQELGA